MTVRPLLASLALLPLLAVADTPGKPGIGEGLKKERELLSNYQWRLRTEMRVDDAPRLLKLEDVHLGPDGGFVKKTVKYEKKPVPTPVPEKDPRARLGPPATDEEDSRFADQAQELMQLYARLTPERLDAWARGAELQPGDTDRPGLTRMHGRGLGRELDDAVLYLDPKTRRPLELEVKTTVTSAIVDIAFLRVSFEVIPAVRPGASPLVVPKRIFLNMNRGRRHVTLEMETSDYRSWP